MKAKLTSLPKLLKKSCCKALTSDKRATFWSWLRRIQVACRLKGHGKIVTTEIKPSSLNSPKWRKVAQKVGCLRAKRWHCLLVPGIAVLYLATFQTYTTCVSTTYTYGTQVLMFTCIHNSGYRYRIYRVPTFRPTGFGPTFFVQSY